MRKLFLTMALGLALGATGLAAAPREAAAAQPLPTAGEALLVPVQYDGRGWGRGPHHAPPRHWHHHDHHHRHHGGWHAPRHHHHGGHDRHHHDRFSGRWDGHGHHRR
jgi:hypothetical protein